VALGGKSVHGQPVGGLGVLVGVGVSVGVDIAVNEYAGPDRVTRCGLEAASVVTVRVAVRWPGAVG
jgi:hypothetical protein